MPVSQTELGKAFEYACLMAIVKYLPKTVINIIEDDPYRTAKKSYGLLPSEAQKKMDLASRAAIRMIYNLEPRLEFGNTKSILSLSIQPDSQGIKGDVRDVLCVRSSEGWEIGLSCKHNHDAVKHSRLSATIDFGKEWLGHPCSETYFSEILPLFNNLATIKRESDGTALWSDIENKASRYYVPILQAFIKEFKRIMSRFPDAPANLIHYLIGREDFYKVITDDTHQTTKIQAVNICGTLNQSYKTHHSITSIPLLRLPDRVFHADFVLGSDNRIEIICNEGWNISMRIHNASSRVEPSLKFDVRLIALPSSIHTQVEPWRLVDGYNARKDEVCMVIESQAEYKAKE